MEISVADTFLWSLHLYSIIEYFPHFIVNFYFLMRFKNSSRVFGSSRNLPIIDEVTVKLPGFWTPLIVMHMWLGMECKIKEDKYKNKQTPPVPLFYLASTTTATPCGWRIVSMATAICLVNLSWTCSLLEYISAIRANLLRPKTLSFGIYPMWT